MKRINMSLMAVANAAIMTLSAFAVAAASPAASREKEPEVRWEILPPETTAGRCVQRLTVTGIDSVAKLCFNQLPRLSLIHI